MLRSEQVWTWPETEGWESRRAIRMTSAKPTFLDATPFAESERTRLRAAWIDRMEELNACEKRGAEKGRSRDRLFFHRCSFSSRSRKLYVVTPELTYIVRTRYRFRFGRKSFSTDSARFCTVVEQFAPGGQF